ncbi:Geranylgeranyl pyrophosphate synthase-like protein [Desulfofarcimen acetoxidans DSM 771]|uniref:Geranylgeranyl pyrophosphate synthase-like protein n=1 Tax=Desulfofarcimen acetoxidans (strain ATCC 49208 / DSM 771 / KCTC 5769 / VKM B-1644 / 5575) TaxID=485916 RepID=C8VWE6_DESAS|nr:polyprenyl synthetase family protein [Desulfofarcimen acetoxidans]ACV62498.1 Geranylgeranyl pyrophosphate synthase-like protein [Desulfofarcimen acetoxidans DSM 771]
MVNQVFSSIKKELENVYQKIERELVIKAGHISSFAHLKHSVIDYAIRPALVIFSGRMFGRLSEKTLALAAVCQFIHMAAQVHVDVNEQSTAQIPGQEHDPRDGSQFPVLVGDYLYGKFFTTLCDYGIVNFLKPLSEIICQINEGGLLRQKEINSKVKSQVVARDVVRRETAELFAGCCSLAAESAEAGSSECLALYKFGKNFGMAYGLLENGMPFDQVVHYLNLALGELSLFNKCQARESLEELVNLFLVQKIAVQRMVV